MSRPVSSSERLGIAIVAAVAIAATAGGIIFSRCRRPEPAASAVEVQTLVTPQEADSVDKALKKERAKARRDSLNMTRRHKNESHAKKGGANPKRSRSPLDEHVSR